MDAFFTSLFDQKIFLIFYGLVGYYVVLWSIARNSKKKLLDTRLKACEGKAERALVYADPEYQFKFKEWLSDQKDEMIVAGFFAAALIEFDELAIEMINRYFEQDITPGNWIYLCGGIIADLITRLIIKLRA